MAIVWKCLAGAGLLLAGIWLLGVIARLVIMARVMRDERRIDREGVDGFAKQVGVGMDVHQKGPGGEGCARIHVEWTHPEKGSTHRMSSPWFYSKDYPELGDKIPVRVVLSDPDRLHRIDLSSFPVIPWKPKLFRR